MAWHAYVRLRNKATIAVIVVAIFLIFLWNLTCNEHENASLRPEISNPYMVKPSTGPDLELLPNLTALPWPKMNRPNKIATFTGFDIALTIGSYQTFQALLLKFQSVMISLNLQDQWFLTAGTLIGSQRHHDVIPWDDDLDVIVNLKYRNLIRITLKRLAPEFGFHISADLDKLFFSPRPASDISNPNITGSFKLTSYPWSWPFLDIFYYKYLNDTHLFEGYSGDHFIKKSDGFPTMYRPLGRNWYPAPRRPLSFLQVYYESNQQVCFRSYWSHAYESLRESESVPCSTLIG